MHAVKVQYEIHDVLPPEPPKKGKTRGRMDSIRPSTAPTSPAVPRITTTKTKASSPSDERSVPVFKSESYSLPPATGPLPKFPAMIPNSNRRRPFPRANSDKPDWNISLSVPDRDLLIMDQDLIIDKYRSKHHQYDLGESVLPQPKLTEHQSRKSMKVSTSEDRRNRVEHHSFGAAVNDPLPHYPFLRHQTGIHSDRWINDSKLPVEHEDWAKPLPKQNKTHESFEKAFRPKNPPLPPQDINVQHSIASVVSSYTLAEQRSLKIKS